MKLAFPALLLTFLVYLLVFPTQLRPELVLRPAWALDLATVPVADPAEKSAQAPFPFDLGDLFGYVSEDGRLLLREKKLFGVAIDEDRYINYSSVSGNLVIYDNSGQVTSSVELPGYPMFRDGRLFLIPTHRAGLAEIVAEERIAWRREYASVITDLDVQSGLVAVALLDSRVQILDRAGAVIFELDMKGSRINAVYGCALSEDATRIAVVHGLDPQNLSIVEIAGETPEISSYRLETEYRKARYLGFYGNDAYLLIERNDGLKILDLAADADYTIGAAGPFLDAGRLGEGNLIWTICGDEEESELIILDPPKKVLLRAKLAGLPATYAKSDKIMLGVDAKLFLLNKVVR